MHYELWLQVPVAPNPEHPPFVNAYYSLSAPLSPMTFCTVELCLSKCRPRRTITPDVIRRVTPNRCPRALPGALCLALLRCTAMIFLALLSGTSPLVSIASCDLLSVATSLVQDT